MKETNLDIFKKWLHSQITFGFRAIQADGQPNDIIKLDTECEVPFPIVVERGFKHIQFVLDDEDCFKIAQLISNWCEFEQTLDVNITSIDCNITNYELVRNGDIADNWIYKVSNEISINIVNAGYNYH